MSTDPLLVAVAERPVQTSNSEITTFQRCRRKWWLTYLLGLKPKQRVYVGPLPLGSRVHKALEGMYKHGQNPVAVHTQLLAADREAMLSDGFDSAELDSEGELGRLMLDGYLEWVAQDGLDANLRIIGVEETLESILMDGRIRLVGRIDLRAEDTNSNTRFILDHKTSARFSDWLGTAHMSTQLLTYITLDKLTNDPSTRVDGGRYRLLKKVKRTARATPPFYQEVEIRPNIFTLRSFWYRLHGVLNDMYAARKMLEATQDHLQYAYPTPQRDCTWSCPFISVCPMFDDGSDVEQALSDNYITADPYSYYLDTADEDRGKT